MILEGCEGTSLPGGPVVKNPPADEEGTGCFRLIPDPGRCRRAPGRFDMNLQNGRTVPGVKARAGRRGALDEDDALLGFLVIIF